MTNDETSDPLGLLARANALQESAKAAAAESAKLQEEIAQLVKIPETGAVTVTFDEAGFMTSLAIDSETRAALDPRALVNEINFAIARASRPLPKPPELSPELLDDPSELFRSIFAMASGDTVGNPTTYANDLGTVVITLVGGSIFSVECSDSWIAASSDSSIANEIIRVAHESLKANDPLGLRKEK